ncbi:MAG: flagellar biosynthesis protein FlhB [Proteobacteria bacterium]|nr:flagellar biosynthesis protein FlhB [Pseudomonadota bacterium]
MADDDNEKTEKPTGKKRQDALKKGQVAKSQELLSLVGLIAGFSSIFLYSGYMSLYLSDFFMYAYFLIDNDDFGLSSLNQLIVFALTTIAKIIAVPMIAIFFFTIIVGFIQNRFVIPENSLKFSIDKLNPITGFKEKFFSLNPVVELVKGCMKLFLLGYLVYSAFQERIWLVPNMIWVDVTQFAQVFEEFAMIVFWRAVIVGILLTVIDYSYQVYKTEESLKMSKQDIKDERKDMEGDPKFRAFRMRRQAEIALGLLTQNVPKADVVVTNPTHFAVALRYRKEESDAPVVVAKGVDFLAAKIRGLADEHKIPIVENAPLARGLYYKTREGQSIAPEFFAAVAEILAVVYRKRNTKNRNFA